MTFVSFVTASSLYAVMCAIGLAAAGLPETQVRTPLVFEPNVGQADSDVRWISRTPSRTFLITRDEARMVLKADGDVATVRMKFLGANVSDAEGIDKLSSTSQYFLGGSTEDWRRDVPHYGRIRYKNAYPGVDVVFYSSDRQLEYDFIVAPGADANVIRMAYEGAERMRVDRNGDLVLEVNGRSLRQLRPKVYQVQNGVRREIPASYRLQGRNRVEFALAKYDPAAELVIDPVLQYSTYFGQEGYDAAAAVTTDRNGDIYVTGVTTSVRFPASQQAQPEFSGAFDAYVAKFTGSGSLVWISYLGGRRNDSGRDIAVDASGNVYVVGSTDSLDTFPVQNATQAQLAGSFDGFLTKLSSDGRQFLFSTFIGGSFFEEAIGVAVDSGGNAYVTGVTTSLDFPLRAAFQTGPSGGGGDIFVQKLSTTRQSIVYSTYVGGNGADVATGIAIDAQGNAYVSGGTTSAIFPIFLPIQPAPRGGRDAFLFKLDPTGTSMVYSTLLGGSLEDIAYRVTVDSQGAAYLAGYTESGDFPTRAGYQTRLGGGFDAFVTKVNPAGSAIEYSTYLGGSGEDLAIAGIAVDAGGSVFIAGTTASSNFPLTGAFQATLGGGTHDVFVARLGPQGNTLLYSSFLGGSNTDQAYAMALDPLGQLIVAGRTRSANFPSVNNQFVGNNLGEYDAFLTRVSADASINFITATQRALTFSARTGTAPPAQTVTIGAGGTALTVTAASDQPWLRASLDRNGTPATLTVSIDTATLPATPSASGVVSLSAPGAANSPLTIAVAVNQMVVPVIVSASPSSLTRDNQDAVVTLTGTGFQNGSSVRLNGVTLVNPLFIDSTSFRVTVPAAVRSSSQSLSFVIVSPDATTQSEPFQLPFTGAGPSIVQSGIVNAASNTPGLLVPGEIITVVGTGFGPAALTNGTVVSGAFATSVGGVRLFIDNTPAPLLYAQQNQIGAIVPYSIAGKDTVTVELEWQGQRSTPVRLNVGGAQPGLFTQNSSGTGQASAVNQDGTVNSPTNPAPAGSVIVLYGTGEGVLFPSGADGRIVTTERPVQPVNVLIGGIPVTPDFAGGSPGSVAGLLQVNVRIPIGLAGSEVPVQLNVGGVLTRQGVTISVR